MSGWLNEQTNLSSSRDDKLLVAASRMSFILYLSLNPAQCFVPIKYSIFVEQINSSNHKTTL